MSNPIIKVDNLSKRYRIGAIEKGYKTFREVIMEGISAPVRNLARLRSLTKFKDGYEEDVIWALKDISFEVNEGEVLGIIGKNGAGKTTLLKILSRITEPTGGSAEIHGRVSSLLEVGTGFHPELTGRENIFLNGAILGMRKREIESKFDEIASFSEIEKFIDTPLKRYSAGMQVRLAFAVAAHLEPEILLVDEVLAVGDAEFQKKCLGKMGDVAKGGRTILFVSHNMNAIKTLCDRVILLQDGCLVEDGISSHVVNTYLNVGRVSRAEHIWDEPARAPGNELARLHSVRVRSEDGTVTSDIDSQCPFDIEVEYWNLSPGARLGATVVIFNQDGICVLGSLSNHELKWHGRPHPEGLFRSVCHMPGNFLSEGRFSVSVLVWADNYSSAYREDDVVGFDIHETAGGVRGDYLGGWSGIVRPMLDWTTEHIDSSS